MFTRFFFLLRAYGVPVTVTEWMMLMGALSEGLALSSLDRFYLLARSILVKSETFYDQYDQAFAACFEGVETPVEIADDVWDWLADPLALPNLTAEEKRLLAEMLGDLDLDKLQRLFEERLAEQTEAHHGGNKWVGTGGTSPFGHSGVHPGGIRVGGESRNRSAVKVAGERRYRGYRTDVKVGVRQFELALRRLRQLSSRNEGPADELDLDATVDDDGRAGRQALARLAEEPQERGQGAARHGRGGLHAPVPTPLQPALQRSQQPDALQGSEDLLLPQLHLRLALPRHRHEHPLAPCPRAACCTTWAPTTR